MFFPYLSGPRCYSRYTINEDQPPWTIYGHSLGLEMTSQIAFTSLSGNPNLSYYSFLNNVWGLDACLVEIFNTDGFPRNENTFQKNRPTYCIQEYTNTNIWKVIV